MAERLEEAVAEAGEARRLQRLIAGVPMAPSENFDGEAVQKVAGLAGPKRPPIVKTIKRNQERVAAGAAVDRELAGVAEEEAGVSFDAPAQSLDQLLDDSDPRTPRTRLDSGQGLGQPSIQLFKTRRPKTPAPTFRYRKRLSQRPQRPQLVIGAPPLAAEKGDNPLHSHHGGGIDAHLGGFGDSK